MLEKGNHFVLQRGVLHVGLLVSSRRNRSKVSAHRLLVIGNSAEQNRVHLLDIMDCPQIIDYPQSYRSSPELEIIFRAIDHPQMYWLDNLSHLAENKP